MLIAAAGLQEEEGGTGLRKLLQSVSQGKGGGC